MENFDETAFPTDADTGMTLRDYFAAKAMQGLVVDAVIDVDAIASMSYRIASAMMKERAVNHG